ncbi:E3 ubiquitin ligase [Olea europaea subsp. europaea]|uniref:E3 ubiquitin ligase n=1 Tax=Olea europaea subsp. europaea TaxID=158383 RepID=A0A8S0PAQ2_OLEEU|nr:E3 ubiquitin ligase [Olea europaea subsp. europaea]
MSHSISLICRIVFFPLWLFHAVVARGRFSLPAPSVPHDRNWAPCHAVVAAPFLVAFELLLCIHLESTYVNHSAAVNLKIVFLPLLAFEVIVLIDNFRMCKALLPGDNESMSEEAIWETLPHFWVAISMIFFLTATVFTVLKLCGDIVAFGWWDLFINYGIAECFSFLVCTKWSNPVIHRNSLTREASSSSTAIRYLDWNSGLVVSLEDQSRNRMCGLQDIGGHIMKIPIIGFQVLLCMHLEGTPPGARHIPLRILFSPIFVLQAAGLMFAASRLVETIVLLLQSEAGRGRYYTHSSRVCDCFAFLHHGSRLLGWWSLDEASREEQAHLFHDGVSGYSTFCGYPPDIVKKLPKKDLAEEVWKLQAALGEQMEITKFNQQEYERLQHEKVLCRLCFEGEISLVLLPCRHRILCSNCSDKCKKCPICRVSIEECLSVYDV